MPPVAVAIWAAAAGSIGSGNAFCRRLAAASGSRPGTRRTGIPAAPLDQARLVAAGEQQCGRLGLEPAGDEGQRLQRLGVEVVRVVDRADQRRLLAGGGDQREHAHPDEEAVRWRALCSPGGDPQRLLVGSESAATCGRSGSISRWIAAYGIVDSAS